MVIIVHHHPLITHQSRTITNLKREEGRGGSEGKKEEEEGEEGRLGGREKEKERKNFLSQRDVTSPTSRHR